MRRLIHGFRQTSISPIVLEPCIQQRLAVLYNPSESSSHPPSNPNQLPRHPLCHTCHLDPPRFNLALIAPPHLRSTSKSSGKNAHTMSPWWLSMCMCASCPHNAPCDPFVALHPHLPWFFFNRFFSSHHPHPYPTPFTARSQVPFPPLRPRFMHDNQFFPNAIMHDNQFFPNAIN